MNRSYRITAAMVICLLIAGAASALEWPVWRDSTHKNLGNGYGQYQCYGDPCAPYMHSGIDILVPPGTPVYAVKAGWVKAVITTSNEYYWRIVIADSSSSAACDAFMYAHLDEYSIPYYAGQYVEEGAQIGTVVPWPYAPFDHLHFSKIRFSGTISNWQNNPSDWDFSANPLDDMDEIIDPDPPIFSDAYEDQLLAFRGNTGDQYFGVGEPLSGDVDIICRVIDYFNDYTHAINPHLIEYKMEGPTSQPWTTAFNFSARIGSYPVMDGFTPFIYEDDAVCNSLGDYDYRDYFFIMTNNDGDDILETGDVNGCWHTPNFTNGVYYVYARAWDVAGNMAIDSMPVTVANYFELSGVVTLDDVVPQPSDGIVITALSSGLTDTSDINGSFSLAAIGGGEQLIEISRVGFLTADTTMMMNQNRTLEISLLPGGYEPGDANCDGACNVGDVVYLVTYVFKGGPPPLPYAAGNVNGDDQPNVGDAVYLIAYIFKGGPPPMGG